MQAEFRLEQKARALLATDASACIALADDESLTSGSQPESVEGLSNNWVIYRLKATIERVRTRKDEITRKNVRIVRTLDPSDVESTLEMVRH